MEEVRGSIPLSSTPNKVCKKPGHSLPLLGISEGPEIVLGRVVGRVWKSARNVFLSAIAEPEGRAMTSPIDPEGLPKQIVLLVLRLLIR